MLTCVDMQHRTCAQYDLPPVYICLCECAVWPFVCHLNFSHHVVIRLHVYSEGLSHLSLAVIEDLNLHKVFLLALLELNVLDTQTVQ